MIKKLICILLLIPLLLSTAGAESLTLHTISCFAGGNSATVVTSAHVTCSLSTTNVLTATETEIVTAIAQGKTTKEIAQERFSSIHTITTHRKNIFRKLGVNTAHEVVKYALRAGLVDSSEFYI